MGVNQKTGEITTDTFVGTLRELRQGAAVTDLSDAMAELVTAVRATGRKGSLVLTLTVAPAARGTVDALLLQDDVKLKLPRTERGATVLFADDHGVLSRNDSRQPLLDGLVMQPPVQPVQLVPRRGAASE